MKITYQRHETLRRQFGTLKRREHSTDLSSGKAPGKGATDLTVRLKELAALRKKYRSGKIGPTVDKILAETRADRL